MRLKRPTAWAFLLLGAIFAAMEAVPAFPDPDSFYHAKITLFLRNGVILHTFPWFSLTDWPTEYVDPHFLYHVLLVPFVAAFDPLVGMKVSAVVFALVACAAFHSFLKWLRAPWPVLLTLAAVLSPALLNRLAFPRAISLSLALFTAIVWAVLARRPRLAFVFSAAFVWLYHGWPTALLVLLAAGVAEIVARHVTRRNMGAEERGPRRTEREPESNEGRSEYGGVFRSWGPIFRVGIAVAAGLALGIVTHPYFPEILSFSVVDIFRIGIVNEGARISVGAEWQPASWWDLAAACWPAYLSLAVGIAAFLRFATRPGNSLSRDAMARVMACLFLAAGFTALTLKSGRYVEYAVPCVVFAAGALLAVSRTVIENEWLPALRARFQASFHGTRAAIAVLAATVAISTVGSQIAFAWGRTHWQASRYAFATDWIRANVPADEVIFHNVWDVSSVLFYLDDTHRYLVGLDPTFFYATRPERYAEWVDLTRAQNTDASKILSDFGARTVLIDERSPYANAFAAALDASGLFHEVARGGAGRLYSCLPDCE